MIDETCGLSQVNPTTWMSAVVVEHCGFQRLVVIFKAPSLLSARPRDYFDYIPINSRMYRGFTFLPDNTFRVNFFKMKLDTATSAPKEMPRTTRPASPMFNHHSGSVIDLVIPNISVERVSVHRFWRDYPLGTAFSRLLHHSFSQPSSAQENFLPGCSSFHPHSANELSFA